MKKLLNLCGMIAPVWLVIGVAIAGWMYPGYSHIHQAMSELHAIGSPVAGISPYINNYPLGILFFGFGVYVFTAFEGWAARTSALMIMLHGIGTIVAGLFPCDVGCNPNSQLPSQQIHGLGAVLMTLTYILAPAIWVFIGKKYLNGLFGAFSALVVIGQFVMFPLLAGALESGLNFGLYQRISYGMPLVWLFVFAWMLYRKPEESPNLQT